MKRYIFATSDAGVVSNPLEPWYQEVDENWIKSYIGVDLEEYLEWLPILEESGYKFCSWVAVKDEFAEEFAYQFPEVAALVKSKSGSTAVVNVEGSSVYQIHDYDLEEFCDKWDISY